MSEGTTPPDPAAEKAGWWAKLSPAWHARLERWQAKIKAVEWVGKLLAITGSFGLVNEVGFSLADHLELFTTQRPVIINAAAYTRTEAGTGTPPPASGPVEVPTTARLEFRKVAELFPFAEASTELDTVADSVAFQRNVQRLYRCAADSLVAWAVVGRSDKRDLRPAAKALYGSNEQLAAARAQRIARRILERADPATRRLLGAKLVVLNGASTLFGPHPAPMAPDRTVEVYMLCQPGPSPPSAEHRTAP
jgi:hypothetical protein